MKRKLKKTAKPVTKKPGRTIEIYLLGGPSHGTTKQVPAGTEKTKIGYWTYTYAGKIDQRTYFAIKLKSHAANRALMKIIGEIGRDPRVEAILRRDQPIRAEGGKDASKGNRKRAARRSSLAGGK